MIIYCTNISDKFRLFVCTNSNNIYLHPNEPGIFSFGINYMETFESNCKTNGNKQRYDDWPSALPFATQGKKGINSNWYNNDYRNGLELKRKVSKYIFF